jgi:YggT family protein
MSSLPLVQLLSTLLNLYCFLIFAWAILSWFQNTHGIVRDIYKVLGTIVEPYIKLFRRFIPPMGGMDLSPLIALLVLQIVGRLLLRLLL